MSTNLRERLRAFTDKQIREAEETPIRDVVERPQFDLRERLRAFVDKQAREAGRETGTRFFRDIIDKQAREKQAREAGREAGTTPFRDIIDSPQERVFSFPISPVDQVIPAADLIDEDVTILDPVSIVDIEEIENASSRLAQTALVEQEDFNRRFEEIRDKKTRIFEQKELKFEEQESIVQKSKTEILEEWGITPETFREIDNLISEQKVLLDEMAAIRTEERNLLAVAEGRSASMTWIRGEQRMIQERFEGRRADLSTHLGSISMIIEQKQGNITKARAIAKDVIETANHKEEREYIRITDWYNRNWNFIQSLDKSLRKHYDDYINKIRNVRDEKRREKELLADLMLKNPRANVSITDTFEEAIQRVVDYKAALPEQEEIKIVQGIPHFFNPITQELRQVPIEELPFDRHTVKLDLIYRAEGVIRDFQGRGLTPTKINIITGLRRYIGIQRDKDLINTAFTDDDLLEIVNAFGHHLEMGDGGNLEPGETVMLEGKTFSHIPPLPPGPGRTERAFITKIKNREQRIKNAEKLLTAAKNKHKNLLREHRNAGFFRRIGLGIRISITETQIGNHKATIEGSNNAIKRYEQVLKDRF